MNRRLVLFVGRELAVAKRITRALESEERTSVRLANWGYEALWAATENVPDIILIDPELPDIDGFEVCRILKRQASTARVPIVIVSARATDRKAGLKAGADDYLAPPFEAEELRARLNVALHRQPAPSRRDNSYASEHLTANFTDGFVAIDGKRVTLSRREFDVLWYLVEHRNQVVSLERLLQDVCGGDESASTRRVVTYVARLRAKLGPAGNQIQTFFRKGYIFTDHPEPG
jgi:DNA-binding response OmpR family regulator